MIGHQQIIDWRRQGMKPAAVFVEAGFVPFGSTRYDDPEQALHWGLYPTVYIAPDELASYHDLRFLVGCNVHLHGNAWSDEVLRLAEAITEVRPNRLTVICDTTEILHWEGEWHAYAA